MRLKTNLVAFALLAEALLLGPIGSANAVDRVWSGQLSGDWAGAFFVTNWFNPNDSFDNGIPDADDVAIFNAANTNKFVVAVDSGRTVQSLEFVGQGFRLNGAPLTLNDGNITTSGSNAELANVISDLVLTDNGIWDLQSGLHVVRVRGEKSIAKTGNFTTLLIGDQDDPIPPSTLDQLLISNGRVVVSNTQLTANALSGSGELLIQNGTTFVLAGNRDSVFSGTLRSAGPGTSFVKQGSGALTLSSGNPGFSSFILLNEGTIVATISSSLGTAVVSETGGNSTLEYQNGVTLNNSIDVSSIRLRVPSGTAAHSGVVMGNGSVTKTGAGTLALTGANFYTGGTTVSAGKLRVNAGSLPASGGVANNTQLEFAQSSDGTYAGAISGSGRVFKTGNGTLAFGANNSYTGGTTISEGRLVVDTGSLPASGGVFIDNFDAQLEFAQTSDGTYSGGISGSGSLSKTGAGTLTLTGANTYTGATFINEGTLQVAVSNLPTGNNVFNFGDLIVEQNVDAVFSGGFFGTGTVTKTGEGRLTLTNLSGHEGGTRIAAGTLAVNAPVGSATGFSDVAVAAGSVFGGSGLSGGKTLVEAGGTLTPSLLPGQLVLGEVRFQSESNLLFEIGGDFTSDLLVNGSAFLDGVLAIDLLPGIFPDASDEFTLLTSDTLTGVFDNVINGGRIVTLGGEGSFLVSYDGATNRVVVSDFVNLPGDYNSDGQVDAADYTVWRDNLGAAAGTLVNDLDGGTIGSAQYDTWRDNFGTANGVGALAESAAVPEPSAACLVLASVLAPILGRQR